VKDVRYALRALQHSPLFAAAAILSLAGYRTGLSGVASGDGRPGARLWPSVGLKTGLSLHLPERESVYHRFRPMNAASRIFLR